jgi:hypothetical protein
MTTTIETEMATAYWAPSTFIKFTLLFSLCILGGWVISFTRGYLFASGFAFICCTIVFATFVSKTIHKLRTIPFVLGICFVSVVFSTTIPAGTFIYTDGAYGVVTETPLFVLPFTMEKPIEAYPPKSGRLKINNVFSENFTVFVSYEFPSETRLREDVFQVFKKAVSDGITLPSRLLSNETNSLIAIQDYLTEKYPYLIFQVEVTLKS